MLKLYYDLMSQPSRAVYLFLKINNIPFTDKRVALRKGEHFTEDFKKINPFQLVPVIDHDGFILTESVAIMRYLCKTFNVPDHWYPSDAKKRARIDEYLSWQQFNIRLPAAQYFQTKVIRPNMTQSPVNEEKLESFRVLLEKSLDNAENVFLKDTPFMNSNEISIADLAGVTELMQPVAAGYDITKDHPILRQYLERVRQQIQPHHDEAHFLVYKMKPMFESKSKL